MYSNRLLDYLAVQSFNFWKFMMQVIPENNMLCTNLDIYVLINMCIVLIMARACYFFQGMMVMSALSMTILMSWMFIVLGKKKSLRRYQKWKIEYCAISWWEQITSWWDDDICFLLDQYAESGFTLQPPSYNPQIDMSLPSDTLSLLCLYTENSLSFCLFSFWKRRYLS
jgi:hypothetical protein